MRDVYRCLYRHRAGTKSRNSSSNIGPGVAAFRATRARLRPGLALRATGQGLRSGDPTTAFLKASGGEAAQRRQQPDPGSPRRRPSRDVASSRGRYPHRGAALSHLPPGRSRGAGASGGAGLRGAAARRATAGRRGFESRNAESPSGFPDGLSTSVAVMLRGGRDSNPRPSA